MTLLANNPSTGLGPMTALPAGSPNGTPLAAPPSGAVGVRIYLPAGASVSFTVAAAQPGAAPTAVFTVSQSATGANWDEALAGGQAIYIVATSGAPLYRWF